MLEFIEKGVPEINKEIKARSTEARAKILCVLAENLGLLNVVASSRPPEAAK